MAHLLRGSAIGVVSLVIRPHELTCLSSWDLSLLVWSPLPGSGWSSSAATTEPGSNTNKPGSPSGFHLENIPCLQRSLSFSALHCLWYIQNSAGRLLIHSCACDHITPVLHNLHWLLVPQQIQFKVPLLIHLIHIWLL